MGGIIDKKAWKKTYEDLEQISKYCYSANGRGQVTVTSTLVKLKIFLWQVKLFVYPKHLGRFMRAGFGKVQNNPK